MGVYGSLRMQFYLFFVFFHSALEAYNFFCIFSSLLPLGTTKYVKAYAASAITGWQTHKFAV